MRGKRQSNARRGKKQLNEKLTPALKAILPYITNTGEMPSSFIGHKINAGEYTDEYGRSWQLQVHVVCNKKKRIKTDDLAVHPMFSWDIRLRLRGFAKYLLDWIK